MSVTRLDLNREQAAHAETREKLEQAHAHARNLTVILRDRPTVEQLQAERDRADRLAAQLAARPTQADVDALTKRAERAERDRAAAIARAETPVERVRTVHARHPDDVAEIARLTALVGLYEREAQAK